MIDTHTRKQWQPNAGKSILRKRGTEYSLRKKTSLMPKPWGMKQMTRWHLYHGNTEITEVMPYRDMDTAIEQAESWIAEAEEIKPTRKTESSLTAGKQGRMAQR